MSDLSPVTSSSAISSVFWVCPPSGGSTLALPLTQVSALLAKLGLSDRHAVAEDVLHLLGPLVPLAQCTIFSFEGTGRPRTVAVGDRARTRELPDISQAYVQRFYRLDGAQQAMQAHEAAARKAPPQRPHIVLHRQAASDVPHPEYRQTCYALPQVAERLAILSLHEGRRWLSVNLYRGLEHGLFSDTEIATVQALAPLIVQAVRLHYTGQVLGSDLMALMMDRLALRGPVLTARDEDVVRGLLQGLSTQALAERLGLTAASAQTYTKRLYRKLGVSGHKELVAWLLGNATD
ncbi:MAG: LuxR family transcriptional regulator [Limnohabitans sp.]|uniref:response regulator transcription factor n=1 Tax=Limnohabitans sp. TaxID=1907725 RepID=UPI0011D8B4AD|nr:MAG: LuxR family transcriptional regulator [Limnohabitans sp.]